jgi:hypothetical protein
MSLSEGNYRATRNGRKLQFGPIEAAEFEFDPEPDNSSSDERRTDETVRETHPEAFKPAKRHQTSLR